MNPMLWHKVAAVSGMTALGLGSYGAHGFKPKNPVYKDVWQTASLYHLVHTAALLAAPLTKNPTVFGGLLTTGILAFSRGRAILWLYLKIGVTIKWHLLVVLLSSLLGLAYYSMYQLLGLPAQLNNVSSSLLV